MISPCELHTCTGTGPGYWSLTNHRYFAGPYVTSVGGTTSFDLEIGSDDPGGGFSYYFPRPDYQQDAVPTFIHQLGYLYAGYYKCVRCRGLT